MLILALLPPAVTALVFAVVIGWDRLREPHRDLARPVAVVDARTYRDAQRRIERLLAAGNPNMARCLMHATSFWLRREIHTGPRRQRVRRAAQLEQCELRLEQTPSGMSGVVR